MFFKRVGSKPFGVSLNKAEQRVLDQAINEQILEHDLQFQMDNDSAILYMLHVHFGFGKKRLKKAWKLFYAEHKRLRDYYQMPDDGGWLCRKRLLEIGADVEAWYEEERKEEANEIQNQ